MKSPGRASREVVLGGLLAYRLGEHAITAAGKRLPISVGFDHDGMAKDIALERHRGGIRFAVTDRMPLIQLSWLRWRFRAYTHWFTQTPDDVRRITVNASDGEDPSSALFSPSARLGRQVTIPDAHFYRYQGFAAARQASESAPAWQERSDDLVWRGGTNGQGRLSFDEDDADDLTVMPRFRMVMKLKRAEGCDVRFVRPYRAREWTADQDRLGFLAEKLPSTSWVGRKYAIDIDGYTNTWSNLLERMHMGCCVLKIGSQHGFRQWYYDRIRPFEHYVPVAADMSDLLEKIEWVRSHDREAQEIARNGQLFARTLDFETGRKEAVDIIVANWGKHG